MFLMVAIVSKYYPIWHKQISIYYTASYFDEVKDLVKDKTKILSFLEDQFGVKSIFIQKIWLHIY